MMINDCMTGERRGGGACLHPSASLSLKQWLFEWYEVYKKPHIKKNSQYPIEVILRLHIPKSISDIPLNKLHVFDIDKAISQLPPSRTQKYLYDVLREALCKAYKIELLKKDISKLIEPVRYKVKYGKALNYKEIDELLKKFQGHKLEKLIQFYILTGCRRHEALTLERSDVDDERKRVLIRGTKTQGSFRYIPLTAELSNLLQSIPDTGARYFPFNDDYVTKRFHKFCPRHKLHDLRHTFATICAESNIHPSATQRLLGHSKIDTTMRVYTHVQSEFLSKEVKKFDFEKILKMQKDR